MNIVKITEDYKKACTESFISQFGEQIANGDMAKMRINDMTEGYRKGYLQAHQDLNK